MFKWRRVEGRAHHCSWPKGSAPGYSVIRKGDEIQEKLYILEDNDNSWVVQYHHIFLCEIICKYIYKGHDKIVLFVHDNTKVVEIIEYPYVKGLSPPEPT